MSYENLILVQQLVRAVKEKNLEKKNISWLSHFLYCLSFAGCFEAGANLSWLLAQGRVHPGLVANPSQG